MGTYNKDFEASIILNALKNDLRQKLHNHFQEQAQPVIKEMVEGCMKDLELTINSIRDNYGFKDVIEVVLREKK